MLEKARIIQDQLSAWRREFHMHPELGFQETWTAGRVTEILTGLGYLPRTSIAKTGVMAEWGRGDPVVAIRADMDGLPLQEANQVPYASQYPGRMHACGHDAHIAMALGAALLLSKERLTGTVRFLFQPSEEVADDQGVSGAPRMIADGAMAGVGCVLALHVEPSTPAGAIRIESGPVSGGVDSWFGEVIGRGGHAAYPHELLDAFYLTGHVMMALNAIVSRRMNPFYPAVVSIGSLHGGNTENVIPERVTMSGTLRYTRPEVQKQIHAEIQHAFELTRTLGGDYVLRIEIGSPPMVNHPGTAELLAEVGRDLLGAENVLPWKHDLGAEDFGCFLEHVPGAMFALGTAGPREARILHSPVFDLNESALPVGSAVLAETALRFLQRGS